MSEQMEFPKTLDEFIKQYSFIDKKEIYTNGSELIQIFRIKQWEKHKQQENEKYKEALSKLNEMNADNYNKYCEELKKNIELKKQLNELKEIEKDHQRLNGELREELKKCI